MNSNLKFRYWVGAFLFLLVFACKKSTIITEEEEEEPVEAKLEVYIPNEFHTMDLKDDASTWSYKRSKESDHFILFWGKGYGAHNPGSSEVPAAYRVDIDDLLKKAEAFYEINVNKLKFADLASGLSKLNKYKMMIFLFYTTDWMAYGGGYDDVIGSLWVSPSTCQPVGSTIAHEIGHSFQYQVRCDLGEKNGFRYGFGGNGGNTFWEQTAQWQAQQSYPKEIFESHHFNVYKDNYHRHVFHELYRYASYFIHYYWADKHGLDIIGRVWREAQQPEDPIQSYKRITGLTDAQFNDELYDAASRFATWDLDALRSIGKPFIGSHSYKFDPLPDNYLRVTKDKCPGTTGYNVIPLEVPVAGTDVSIQFSGLVNEPGFNPVSNTSRAGWRYGYVALLENGNRFYGAMQSGTTNDVSFKVPENCSKLWFIVVATPASYAPHPWDDDENNDEQWPYKIKVTNTNVAGYVLFGEDDEPQDAVFNYELSFAVDTVNYSGTTVAVNPTQLAKAFVLQPSQIAAAMGKAIKFYAVESNGALNATTTANGYGHWFDKDGNVINWGAGSVIFSEYNAPGLVFSIGQYPKQVAKGDSFVIKQALVYEYAAGSKVQATFVFNIKIQ